MPDVAPSVAAAAAELALRVVGDLSTRRVLVVDAGKMSELATGELVRRGASVARQSTSTASRASSSAPTSSSTLFFRRGPVRSLTDASASDTDRYGALFRHLLERGVYLPPSQFEAMFFLLAHGDAEIEGTIEHVADFFADNASS
jgi:glutamate-1-semialdehyde aminotransferase